MQRAPVGETLFLKPEDEFSVGVEGGALPPNVVTGTVHKLISQINISFSIIECCNPIKKNIA